MRTCPRMGQPLRALIGFVEGRAMTEGDLEVFHFEEGAIEF